MYIFFIIMTHLAQYYHAVSKWTRVDSCSLVSFVVISSCVSIDFIILLLLTNPSGVVRAEHSLRLFRKIKPEVIPSLILR